MKVLIITNLFPNSLEPDRATYNRNQFKHLAEFCEVQIIAPIAWTDRISFFRKSRKKIPHTETIDGMCVTHPTYFFPPKVLRFTYGIFFLISIFSSYLKAKVSFKPDVVFATWAYPDGFAALALAKLVKLPFVLKVHGSDIHSIDGLLREKLTGFTLRHSDKVISVSNDLLAIISRLNVSEDKITVLYNGVDGEYFQPAVKKESCEALGINSDKRYILYVGNLKVVKGADLLPELAVMINMIKEDIFFVIIGNGTLLSSMKKEAVARGIADKISFLGSKDHKTIALWMNAVDLLILPSRNEGVPNVILEAMSCGLPVVASNVGGVSEVVIENVTGVLGDSCDTETFGKLICSSLDKWWDETLIAEEAAKYSWKANTSLLFQTLQSVHKNRS